MDDARAAIAAWDLTAEPRPVASGLINRTWELVADGRPVGVLQALNTRIFRPVVHEDIEAVTAHLAAKGLPTPRLVRTRAGGLWHEDAGGCWRVLTPVGDRTVEKLTDPADARAAAALVGRFHAATADLAWDFRMVRPGAHDTERHVARLIDGLERHKEHRLHGEVARLADGLLGAWARWSGPRDLPAQIIHGDLKISNVRFAGAEAAALIDLDTLAHGTLDVELGDAMRSWCNPHSEDHPSPTFDLGIFAAAMAGYASAADFGPTQRAAIVPGTERIALELACRFALDALDESYFGWNPRFGTRGDHNLLRARGQAALAASLADQRAEAERLVRCA